MICPSCEKEIHPTQRLVPGGGFISHCPRDGCGARIPAAKPAEVTVAALADLTPAKPQTSRKGVDIIADMRARLVELDAMIAERQGLEAEREWLAKALAAADEHAPKTDAAQPAS